MSKYLITCILFGFSSIVVAQTAEKPKHNCVKVEYPGKHANSQRLNSFQKSYTAYRDCIKKFVDDNQGAIKLHTEAANEAINEFNAYTKEVNVATGRASATDDKKEEKKEESK